MWDPTPEWTHSASDELVLGKAGGTAVRDLKVAWPEDGRPLALDSATMEELGTAARKLLEEVGRVEDRRCEE